MARTGKPKKIDDSRGGVGYRATLRNLANANLNLIVGVLSELVAEISAASEYSVAQRREALQQLLAVIVRCTERLPEGVETSQKVRWQGRNRSQPISPFEFLAEHYAEEVTKGSLTKSDIRQSDFPLYRALMNPYWATREPQDNIFSRLPSKKTMNDDALRSLPKGTTRSAIVKALPPGIGEIFRLLHVAEMRRHRSKKRSVSVK